MECTALALAEGLQLASHVQAHVLQIGRRLVRHATDLEASAEVHCSHFGKLLRQIERHTGDPLPYLGVGSRANMTMEARDPHAVALSGLFDRAQIRMPDAEA